MSFSTVSGSTTRDMIISGLSVSDLKHPGLLWASAFGVGFLPKAPGTWGSMFALLVWWLFIGDLEPLIQAMIIAVYFALSVYACHRVCRDFAVKDAGEMVADEVVGMWLALFALPNSLFWLALGFILFRFLDIKKPLLIGYIDRHVTGGLGVILDDVVAGIFTCILLSGLVFAFHELGINVF